MDSEVKSETPTKPERENKEDDSVNFQLLKWNDQESLLLSDNKDYMNINLTTNEDDNGSNGEKEANYISHPIQNKSDNTAHNEVDGSSSDESNDLMNTKEVLKMFDKLAKESIQKIMLNNFSSETSSDSANNDNKRNIDDIIDSDPQQLIFSNNHLDNSAANSNEEIENNIIDQWDKNLVPELPTNEQVNKHQNSEILNNENPSLSYSEENIIENDDQENKEPLKTIIENSQEDHFDQYQQDEDDEEEQGDPSENEDYK